MSDDKDAVSASTTPSPPTPKPSPNPLKRKDPPLDDDVQVKTKPLSSSKPLVPEEYKNGHIICSSCGLHVNIRDDESGGFTVKMWEAHRAACFPPSTSSRDRITADSAVIYTPETAAEVLTHPPTKRRRAKRTEEERIDYLRADPYVAQFEAYRVLCASCDKWIRLRPNSTYCSIPWDAHRKSCLAKKINNKNAYALEERNDLFSQDPDIRKFDAERLLCNRCDQWLDVPAEDHLLAVQKWLHHRATCRKDTGGGVGSRSMKDIPRAPPPSGTQLAALSSGSHLSSSHLSSHHPHHHQAQGQRASFSASQHAPSSARPPPSSPHHPHRANHGASGAGGGAGVQHRVLGGASHHPPPQHRGSLSSTSTGPSPKPHPNGLGAGAHHHHAQNAGAKYPAPAPRSGPSHSSHPTNGVGSDGNGHPSNDTVNGTNGDGNAANVGGSTNTPSPFHSLSPHNFAPLHESRRRNAEQRADTLRKDCLIGAVEPNRVFCALCQKWVQLRQDSSFCAYPWLQHRSKCVARHQRRAQKIVEINEMKARRGVHPALDMGGASNGEEDDELEDELMSEGSVYGHPHSHSHGSYHPHPHPNAPLSSARGDFISSSGMRGDPYARHPNVQFFQSARLASNGTSSGRAQDDLERRNHRGNGCAGHNANPGDTSSASSSSGSDGEDGNGEVEAEVCQVEGDAERDRDGDRDGHPEQEVDGDRDAEGEVEGGGDEDREIGATGAGADGEPDAERGGDSHRVEEGEGDEGVALSRERETPVERLRSSGKRRSEPRGAGGDGLSSARPLHGGAEVSASYRNGAGAGGGAGQVLHYGKAAGRTHQHQAHRTTIHANFIPSPYSSYEIPPQSGPRGNWRSGNGGLYSSGVGVGAVNGNGSGSGSRHGGRRRRYDEVMDVDLDAEGDADADAEPYGEDELSQRHSQAYMHSDSHGHGHPHSYGHGTNYGAAYASGVHPHERSARRGAPSGPVSGSVGGGLRRAYPVGLMELDSPNGRKSFVARSIEYLFGTTYEATDDLTISVLVAFLNAAVPQDKHEDFDTGEVVKYVAALKERGRVVFLGDVVRPVD